LLEWSSLSV